MTETAKLSSTEIKACCAALYQSEWARLLLGDSLHPGGLALTQRLGALLGLTPPATVLDVASGNGSSAIFLAQRFGCKVVGMEYSSAAVAEAVGRAAQAGLARRVQFLVGEGEGLPLADATFDAVVCECAFCTFPDKATGAQEFARVLRPGGKLGLADLTRSGPLPSELETLLAWVACVADALPIADYQAHFQRVGMHIELVEPHHKALSELLRDVRRKLLGAELLAKLGGLELPVNSLDQAKAVAKAAAAAIEDGRLGYSLVVATRL